MCAGKYGQCKVFGIFSFSWSYNFVTNFSLKLKNFVFFSFQSSENQVIFSKTIFSICMSFCSNYTLIASLVKSVWIILFMFVKTINLYKTLRYFKELGIIMFFKNWIFSFSTIFQMQKFQNNKTIGISSIKSICEKSQKSVSISFINLQALAKNWTWKINFRSKFEKI